MANDDDFTFCQVGEPDNQDYVDAQKIAQDISEIRIKDEPSNDAGTSQSNSAPWEGKLGSIATSKKQGTVGSLSFTVIDTSPGKQANGTSGQVASKDGVFSVPTYQKQIKPARKPAARAKVPYEKGYSQMDWLKLTRTHPDLAGCSCNFRYNRGSAQSGVMFSCTGLMQAFIKSLITYQHKKVEPVSFECRSLKSKTRFSGKWEVSITPEHGIVKLGLKGQSNRRLISIDEVKEHQNAEAMWTVLKGHVYNITPYMKFHPGGVDMLMKAVGKDCTALFNKYHAWVNAEVLMEKCLVGILDDSK